MEIRGRCCIFVDVHAYMPCSAKHSPDELAMGKQRILLVDDEPDILEFIEYNLQKATTFTPRATEDSTSKWPKSCCYTCAGRHDA